MTKLTKEEVEQIYNNDKLLLSYTPEQKENFEKYFDNFEKTIKE